MDEDFELGFIGVFETVKWRFVEQVNVRYLVGRGLAPAANKRLLIINPL